MSTHINFVLKIFNYASYMEFMYYNAALDATTESLATTNLTSMLFNFRVVSDILISFGTSQNDL